ncbi:MAG: hypothetical protein ACI4JC_10080, partial [Faecalibacterium sp.]
GTVTPAPHGPYRAYKVRRSLPYANKKLWPVRMHRPIEKFLPRFFQKAGKEKSFFGSFFSKKEQKTANPRFTSAPRPCTVQ